jgi:GxxExxY protein
LAGTARFAQPQRDLQRSSGRSATCTFSGVLQNPGGLNALTERIIGGAIAVHRKTGPGLLESVYHGCLIVELRLNGLRVETERRVPVQYRGFTVGDGFRIDCIVDDKILVEVKAVDRLAPVHSAQVITYLKLTGYPVGLLINFNVRLLKDGVRRLVHPDYRESDQETSCNDHSQTE